MTGDDHFRKAEQLLEEAAQHRIDCLALQGIGHALLACAAATVDAACIAAGSAEFDPRAGTAQVKAHTRNGLGYGR